MRSLALALAVFMLGNALADHDWLLALPLAIGLISGLVLLSIAACDAPPSASAQQPRTEQAGRGQTQEQP